MSKLTKPESSNPILKSARTAYAAPRDLGGEARATMAGVVNKTAILLSLAMLAGALAYAVAPATTSVLIAGCLASAVVGIGVAWLLAKDPSASPTLAPVYALVEGAFLGVFTKALDGVLAVQGATAPGTEALGGASLALPALVITFACTASMLILYRTGLLRPTQTFKAVLSTLTLGVLMAYLANLVLELMFGMHLPFLSIRSAFEGGTPALIGLGLNALILVLASLWLVVDMEQVEELVESGSPAELEWYGAFGLLVTLAWIYYEALKLAFRVALTRD